jgi:hypothetical protein
MKMEKTSSTRFKSVKGSKRKGKYNRMNKTTMMGVMLATLTCMASAGLSDSRRE